MIRQKISSDVDSMDKLHLKYGWIPGSESIRPDPTVIEKKKNYITNMLERYVSLQDFVLHRIFRLKPIVQGDWNKSRLHVPDAEISSVRLAVAKTTNRHEVRYVSNLFYFQDFFIMNYFIDNSPWTVFLQF